MKVTFLGTRGYIEARTSLHRLHTSARFTYHGRGVVVDCGEDWLDRLDEMAPRAIFLTHAHPDHAGGLKLGSPCPVYAVRATWETLEHAGRIEKRETLQPRRVVRVQGIAMEAFPVEHSIRAPAVGYRITAGEVAVFYVPDLVYIRDRRAALRGCAAYVGDGSTISRSFVRRRGDRLFGHVPIRTQIGWCRKEGVPRAIFTHCGAQIVEGDERTIGARLLRMGEERGGVRVEIAHDGMEIVLR